MKKLAIDVFYTKGIKSEIAYNVAARLNKCVDKFAYFPRLEISDYKEDHYISKNKISLFLSQKRSVEEEYSEYILILTDEDLALSIEMANVILVRVAKNEETDIFSLAVKLYAQSTRFLSEGSVYSALTSNVKSDVLKLPDDILMDWKNLCFFKERSVHVFLTHGIRTYASWFSVAKDIFSRADCSVTWWKFGFFDLFQFVIGRSVIYKLVINLLIKILEAHNIAQIHGAKFTVICHSFGTLLLGRALELAYRLGIKLNIDCVILNGSILPADYRWEDFFHRSSCVKVNEVHNLRGKNDFWPLVAGIIRQDYGSAGTFGFNVESERIHDYVFDEGHSGILKEKYIRDYWLNLAMGRECPSVNAGASPNSYISIFSWLAIAVYRLRYLALFLMLFYINETFALLKHIYFSVKYVVDSFLTFVISMGWCLPRMAQWISDNLLVFIPGIGF